MIHSITYSVTFPSTGRTLSETLQFQKGLGAIVGANEAGKSFVVEMIRYALFGSAALRGSADDYRNLSVELSLTIRKENFRIVRNPRAVGVWRDDEQLATGIKPVNAKIVEILGYDLAVFDIANVANQGDIEKLLSMRPAERKSMIDRVIGLDRLDELSNWAGQEALGLAREANGLSQHLVEPVEPVRPDVPSIAVLDEQVVDLRGLEARLNQLKGILSQKVNEPEVPVDEFPSVTVEHAEARAELQKEFMRLSALPAPSSHSNDDLTDMLAQHDAYDMWRAREAFLNQHPRPTMEYGEVLEGFEAHRLEEHRAGLTRQLKTAEAGGKATCPCGMEFELQHQTIMALEEQLSSLPTPKPLIDLATLKREESRHKDWNHSDTNEKWRQLETVAKVDVPRLPRAAISGELRKNAEAADPVYLRDLREQFTEDTIDWPTVLEAKRRFASKAAVYATLKAQYDETMKARFEAEQEAGSLGEAVQAYGDVPGMLALARAHEAALVTYRTLKADYDARSSRVEDLRQREAGYRAGRAAIASVRTRVKAYIIPSLNKVASHLLSQMTGGQRQSILIDNDFEVITVDRQSIDTLSGSGKACASLAIRIGLGQVLTNNVLSLFVGDEIDASMDASRATNVAELLVNLQDRILQLLLVTHKSPEADYTIRIGENMNAAK